jgi:SAM-dependent methyltransferase
VIEFTGERVVPGQVDADLWAEHISRYAFASRWAPGARVLDLGCGEGYGTAELADKARSAVGIDLAPEAIVHARAAYALPNVFFLPASATALPFRGASFELVTAFEVIEHLTDWRALLAEGRRLLHPSGVFLVSTPNKEYYTDSRGSSGPNPFHTHEFEFDEFRSALREFFPFCTVLLQNHVEAFAFYRPGGSPSLDGRMDGARGTPQEAHFFLAICALRDPPPPPGFLFVHQGSNVLREREKHIESLQQELHELRSLFAALRRDHEEKTRWALNTVKELEAVRRDFTTVLQNYAVSEATVIERTLRAEDLNARINLWRASRWTKLGRKLNLGPDLDQSPTKSDATGGGS